jgi:P pilus assembly chaperone PapD
MKADGTLESVTTANDREKAAESMILYAPRKVTLPPNQPQSIRVTARAPQGLPDGEYRVHMLFRAIPDPKPVTEKVQKDTLSFRLIPVYGVTIPVIVRLGQLEATAGIADVKKIVDDGKPAVKLDLTRNGDRSVYGEVRVTRPGVDEPIAVANGIAIYPEVIGRSVVVPIDPKYAAQATGPVKVSYVERTPTGLVTLAETSAVLR